MDVRVAVAILIGLAVLAVIAVWVYQRLRSERLRRRFGPEYDRLVAARGDRRQAESELEARRRRVRSLHLRELDSGTRARFADSWRSVQATFPDDPNGAVRAADRLVLETLEACGYPVLSADAEQQAADLSVHHARVVDDYRRARETAALAETGRATTEDLRQTMISYRTILEDLLGERARKWEMRHDRAA